MVTKTGPASTNWHVEFSKMQHSEVLALPTRWQLLALLDELQQDERALSQAASLSYRHQLGFEKYVLVTQPSGACLRMHYWSGVSIAEEDIHSHCADFRSLLLLGQLTEQKFSMIAGDTHSAFRYRFDAVRGESEISVDGVTAIQESQARTLMAGDSYTNSAESLHRVSAVKPGTVTVSSWGPRLHDAVVLKPSNQPADPCCARAGMNVEILRARLQEIRQRIAST